MKRRTPDVDALLAQLLDKWLSKLAAVEPAKEYAEPARISTAGKGPPYIGRCFAKSLEFFHWLAAKDHHRKQKVARRRGTWLVHGKCLLGGCGEHAWVELPGGVCYDAVYHRFVTRRSYYKVLHASPFQKYTPEAALLIMEYLIRSNPQVYDAKCPAQEPWWFIWYHMNRSAEKVLVNWFHVFHFPMNPARPVLIDARKAAALIEARKRLDAKRGSAGEFNRDDLELYRDDLMVFVQQVAALCGHKDDRAPAPKGRKKRK